MSKILALDYGTRHMGLAISDDEQKVALPFQTINVKGKLEDEKDKIIEDLVTLVEVEEIGSVIIGMPLNASGGRTKLGDEIFQFSKELTEKVDVQVDVIDERFTSKLATQLPHKTARNIHELSAQILLQEFLDKP